MRKQRSRLHSSHCSPSSPFEKHFLRQSCRCTCACNQRRQLWRARWAALCLEAPSGRSFATASPQRCGSRPCVARCSRSETRRRCRAPPRWLHAHATSLEPAARVAGPECMPRRLRRAVFRALARGGGAPDPPAATTHAVSFRWAVSLSGSFSGRPPSVDCTHAWPRLGIWSDASRHTPRGDPTTRSRSQ